MKGMAVLAMLLMFVCFVILGPCLTIWSLNALFHLGIETTLRTWFAALWIFGLFATKFQIKRS